MANEKKNKGQPTKKHMLNNNNKHSQTIIIRNSQPSIIHTAYGQQYKRPKKINTQCKPKKYTGQSTKTHRISINNEHTQTTKIQMAYRH